MGTRRSGRVDRARWPPLEDAVSEPRYRPAPMWPLRRYRISARPGALADGQRRPACALTATIVVVGPRAIGSRPCVAGAGEG